MCGHRLGLFWALLSPLTDKPPASVAGPNFNLRLATRLGWRGWGRRFKGGGTGFDAWGKGRSARSLDHRASRGEELLDSFLGHLDAGKGGGGVIVERIDQGVGDGGDGLSRPHRVGTHLGDAKLLLKDLEVG